MIEVNGVAPWCAVERTSYPVAAGHGINIAARDVRRAARFYERAFGFYPVGSPARDVVILVATARVDLVIRRLDGNVAGPSPSARAMSFIVTDLDRVREAVWELGIRVARDSGAPDHIYRWRNGRSLYVRAPDRYEIELVELWNGAYPRSTRGSGTTAKVFHIPAPAGGLHLQGGHA